MVVPVQPSALDIEATGTQQTLDALQRMHALKTGALIRAAVAEARARGARRLNLRVLGHNTPARKLYEAEGFAVGGDRPEVFFLDVAYVDDICMVRAV